MMRLTVNQISQMLRCLLCVSALLWLPLAVSAEAPDSDAKTWTVNIRNADIDAFITQVAEMTGKNFVVDPRVRTRDVTVISNQPLTSDEVYELFLSVLQVHGYAAVPSGNVVKIVNNTTAKQSNLPLEEGAIDGQELITRVIAVENTPVDELVPVLRPLVPQYGHLAAVGSANVLIVSDHADNIRRLENILRNLEGAESKDVEILALEHAWVGELIKLLENLVPEKGGKKKGPASSITLVADERTNRLIVRGDRFARQRIRALVAELDVATGQSGSLQVIRLSNADAKEMAELLKNFAENAPGTAASGEQAAATGKAAVSIQADESLNALVIRAEPALMNDLKAVISQLDVRRAQILIEAAIVEVGLNQGSKLGFQYAAGDQENGVGGVNFSNPGTTSLNSIITAIAGDGSSPVGLSDGITFGGGELDADGNLEWGVLVQAFADSGNANLLSTPSILTLDNEEASITVGQNVPFVTGQSTSTGAGVSNPFTTIEREDVGLTLNVTPHLAGDSTVRLKIEQETSNVSDSSGVAVDIVTETRKINTTVLANAGETIVLGGLIKDEVRESVRKVPILGDIPLLGFLFRSKNKSQVKQNLMVFLRPTILGENDDRLVELSQRRYMGITAMQFEVDGDGELKRVEKFPLPVDSNDLFTGRDSISPEFEAAVRQANGITAEPEVQNQEDTSQIQEDRSAAEPISENESADEAP